MTKVTPVPTSTNPRRHDLVISYAREDEDLVAQIQTVLRNGGVKRIYRYQDPPQVQHSEDLPHDWKLACEGNPGPFFLVVFSQSYSESDHCMREYQHILELVFGTGLNGGDRVDSAQSCDPSLADLQPCLIVRLGLRPAVHGAYTANHCYLDGHNGGDRIDQDHVVRNLIAKIRRTRPDILTNDSRGSLLKYWDKPAFERWPFALQNLNCADPAEVDLIESNIALAAGIGLSQQIGRCLGVIRCLERIFLDAEYLQQSSREAHRIPKSGALPRSIRDLLNLFVKENRAYEGDVSDEVKELVVRLQNYLAYHTGSGNAQAENFVRVLRRLSNETSVSWSSSEQLPKLLHRVRITSAQFIDELASRLARVAEKHSRIVGPSDNLIFGLQDYSTSVSDRIRRRIGDRA